MEVYRANGAQLGWLLIPEQQAVEIWRASNDPGAAPERLEPSTARLEDPLLPDWSDWTALTGTTGPATGSIRPILS